MTDETPIIEEPMNFEPEVPRFVPIDETAILNAGILMAANERFFWPLGMALTVDRDPVTGEAKHLHVRQNEWSDGHREIISQSDDQLMRERRAAFLQFVQRRITKMPPDERAGAIALIPDEPIIR